LMMEMEMQVVCMGVNTSSVRCMSSISISSNDNMVPMIITEIMMEILMITMTTMMVVTMYIY
jgi:hypothetical protein